MEYLAFKQYLGKIFGVTEVTEDQDIFVTLDSRFISRRDSENLSFTIANDELKELFLKVTAASFNGLEYFTNNTYEIAVDQDWYPVSIEQIFQLWPKIRPITLNIP